VHDEVDRLYFLAKNGYLEAQDKFIKIK
jgi:hypothetical protein